MNQENRKAGKQKSFESEKGGEGKNGFVGCLKLVRLPPSLAATLATLPSIPESLSSIPAFLLS